MIKQWATWTVTHRCDATPRCRYCIQGSVNSSNHPEAQIILGIVAGLRRLPGVWDVSLLGGEIFDIDGFEDLLSRMCAETRHRFSFSSNFQVGNDCLARVLADHRASLTEMRFSYHADQWPGPGAFLDKLRALRDTAAFQASGVRLKVPILLVPKDLEGIAGELVPGLAHLGVDYFLQYLRVWKNGEVIPFRYTAEQSLLLARLEATLSREKQIVRASGHRDALCRAGSRLVAIQPNGDVYACFNYSDEKDARGYLGNFCTSEVRLFDEPIRCVFSNCACGTADYNDMIVSDDPPRP